RGLPTRIRLAGRDRPQIRTYALNRIGRRVFLVHQHILVVDRGAGVRRALAATGVGIVVSATQPTTLTAATVAASASAIACGAGDRRGASTVGSAANSSTNRFESSPREATPIT